MADQYQSKAKVLKSERLATDVCRLTLLCPDIAKKARPGQFVMLRIAPAALDPLIRRPFSIYQTTAGGQLQILYKVVGKGTGIMAGLHPGDMVDLVGPLGTGFPIDVRPRHCLIGGGMGAAPLFFLATWLLRHPDAEPVVLLGARNREELRAIAPEFENLGIPVGLATDDGSEGHHGYVVDLLADSLTGEERPWHVFSCGPYPMLRAVAKLCHLRSRRCHVSLETMMACGIGACLGCALPRAGLNGYLHVCRDGPVLEAGQVAWF
ncbi:MAG: dihydroorotate dehydrogenase electron transfer subunit [Desulfobacteraceae bacterium]|nr:dihydroorotate dehydrogenase electron transfer subunit [Desulfobacteraceae bacterium]